MASLSQAEADAIQPIAGDIYRELASRGRKEFYMGRRRRDFWLEGGQSSSGSREETGPGSWLFNFLPRHRIDLDAFGLAFEPHFSLRHDLNLPV